MASWSVGYFYDLIDERTALTGGSQWAVLWVLNQISQGLRKQLSKLGHAGVATGSAGN